MLTLSDEGFKKYGKKLDIDVDEIVSYLDNLTLPLQGNKYVASDEKFEERDKLEKSSLKTGVSHCVDKIPSYILRLLCVRA